MSLTVNWKAADGAAKYRVYRATKRFTNSSLPTDKVEVNADVLSKTYDDAVRNTTYWFSISSVDTDGVETFGEPFAVGYFPETGVGPSKLLRGDWSFGYFGEVGPTDLFTSAQLQSWLSSKGATGTPYTTALTVWHKFVVNGKIIFVPDRYITYQGQVNMPVMLPANGIAMTVKDSWLLENGGWQYRYRLPHASLDDSKYLTTFAPDTSKNDFQSSEAGMLISMFSYSMNANSPDLVNAVIDAGALSTTRMRLLDVNTYAAYVPVAALDAGNNAAIQAIQANGSLTLSTGNTLRFWPILELVL